MSRERKNLKVKNKVKKNKKPKKTIKNNKDYFSNYITKNEISEKLQLDNNDTNFLICRLLVAESIFENIKDNEKVYFVNKNIKIPFEYIESHSPEELKVYFKVGLSSQELINYFSYLATSKEPSKPIIKTTDIINSNLVETINIKDLTIYRLKKDIDNKELDKYLDLNNREIYVSNIIEKNIDKKEEIKPDFFKDKELNLEAISKVTGLPIEYIENELDKFKNIK